MGQDEEINYIIDGLIELGFDFKKLENIKSFILSILGKQSLDECGDFTDITF